MTDPWLNDAGPRGRAPLLVRFRKATGWAAPGQRRVGPGSSHWRGVPRGRVAPTGLHVAGESVQDGLPTRPLLLQEAGRLLFAGDGETRP